MKDIQTEGKIKKGKSLKVWFILEDFTREKTMKSFGKR